MTDRATIVDRLRPWLAGLAMLLAPLAVYAETASTAADRAATAACIARSGLLRASVRPGRVHYDESLGVDAMLVAGTSKATRLPGRRTTLLCLYHRGSRTAEVVLAPHWTSR